MNRSAKKSGIHPSSKMTSIVLALGVVMAGCGSPTEPPCRIDHTADLVLKNTSTTKSMDVSLNGSIVATLPPGGTLEREVASGMHRVRFLFAGSNTLACDEATPNIAQCGLEMISCTARSGECGRRTVDADCAPGLTCEEFYDIRNDRLLGRACAGPSLTLTCAF